MSLTSTQLWQRIAAAGLASPMQCRAWATEVTANLPAAEAADPQRLATALVAQGKLTAFQADTILSGSDQPLVIHGWRILEPVASPEHPAPDARCVWLDWWQATKGSTAPVSWLRWLRADDLKSESVAASAPSLPLVLRHSQVKSPLLQRVDPPEMSGGQLQLSVEPVGGQLLSGLCDGKPRPLALVWRMLIDIATALAALHASGLVHGRVTPDRIVMGADGRCRLMRDPLCGLPMSTTTPASSGVIAQRLPGKLSGAHFMAPEFVAPTPVASPASDCYGLGAIAWLLLTGQPPFAARTIDSLLAAHAQQPLNLSLLGEQPEPVVRCLVHLLAKNPQARFTSAAAVLRAAEEVSRILAQGKVRAETSSSGSPSAGPQVVAIPVTAVQTPAVQTPAVPTPAVQTQVASQATPQSTKQVATSTSPVAAAKANEPVAAKTQTTAAQVTAQPTVATAGTAAATALSASANQVPAASTVAASAAPIITPTVAPAVPVNPVSPAVRRPVRRPAVKRKQANPWLTPIIGGGGVVVLLLILMQFRGGGGGKPVATKPTASSGADATAGNDANAKTSTGSTVPDSSGAGSSSTGSSTGDSSPKGSSNTARSSESMADARSELFDLVENNSRALWAPPRVPKPIALDLLPPGGQIFIALRPQAMFSNNQQQTLLKLLEPDLEPMWRWVRERTGFEPNQISELVLASYSGAAGQPLLAARLELATPKSAEELRALWNNPVENRMGNERLWSTEHWSYYSPTVSGVPTDSISRFSVGASELMLDVVNLQGAAGPLPAALERLLQSSDRQSELNILMVPSFLFTDGRPLLSSAPPRLTGIANDWLQRDMRGASLTINLQGDGFYELRLVGASDRDAAPNEQRLRDALTKLPQQVESWFVEAMPHAYWRALALRYPNMLRALASQSRTGVESGQAIANGYLPASAMQNLIVASWIAMQPGATSSGPAVTAVAAEQPLTAEQILERNISVSVDQQGIEVVLQLIGEQANEKLPPGTRPLKFELDGSGFQRAGFTRNQQVKNFQIKGQSVRAALTELARRQNPVPGVRDLKSAEQKMVWLLLNADKPDAAQVSLTSRDAATTAGLKLPSEFAP